MWSGLDSGTVEIRGERIERASAAQAQSLGLAIVHQHPAVLPELTVAENMLLAVPERQRRPRRGNLQEKEWVAAELQRVGCDVSPHTRMSEVGIADRQLYELAKALAIDPKVLIPMSPLPRSPPVSSSCCSKRSGGKAREAPRWFTSPIVCTKSARSPTA